jgi:putative CocE/NonD family hydrolase
MATELLRFFDRYLKNVDNGWDREPPIYFRTVNAEPDQAWASASQWPLPQAHSRTLHFASDEQKENHGSLATTAPTSNGANRFVVDYQPRCKDRAQEAFMVWPCVPEKYGTTYTTPPLARDTQIAGHSLVDVWMSSTQPDADLFVYLEDVAPSGESAIVTHGRLRASFRSEQKPPYRNYMGLPYHRGNRKDVKPLTPGERTRMRIDMLPTSTIIKSGHRLRLSISGADPRQRSRSVQFDPPPMVAIFSGEKSDSMVSLQILGELEFASVDAVGSGS